MQRRGFNARQNSPASVSTKPEPPTSEPPYEVIEFSSQQQYTNTAPLKNTNISKSNDKKIVERKCDLCGCSNAQFCCDICVQQTFCMSCDQMYHRHPKRQMHVRKRIQQPIQKGAEPPLPPKNEFNHAPIPPPRKNKRTGRTGSSNAVQQGTLKKNASLMGSLKRFMGGMQTNTPQSTLTRNSAKLSNSAKMSNTSDSDKQSVGNRNIGYVDWNADNRHRSGSFSAFNGPTFPSLVQAQSMAQLNCPSCHLQGRSSWDWNRSQMNLNAFQAWPGLAAGNPWHGSIIIPPPYPLLPADEFNRRGSFHSQRSSRRAHNRRPPPPPSRDDDSDASPSDDRQSRRRSPAHLTRTASPALSRRSRRTVPSDSDSDDDDAVSRKSDHRYKRRTLAASRDVSPAASRRSGGGGYRKKYVVAAAADDDDVASMRSAGSRRSLRTASSFSRPPLKPYSSDSDDELTSDKDTGVKMASEKLPTIGQQCRKSLPNDDDKTTGNTSTYHKTRNTLPQVDETKDWECEHCTYLNSKQSAVCDVCCKSRTSTNTKTPTKMDDDDGLEKSMKNLKISTTGNNERKKGDEKQDEIVVKSISTGTSPPPQTISTQTYDIPQCPNKRNRSLSCDDYSDWNPAKKQNSILSSSSDKQSSSIQQDSSQSSEYIHALLQNHVKHGAEIVKLLKEAESHNFELEDVTAALAQCGDENPIKWLLENWNRMIDTVVTLATNYGRQQQENIIGTISSVEAQAALRLHNGEIWAAVTECVRQRQNKYSKLMARGQYSREDVVTVLTANHGDLEAAHMELNKYHLKPLLMKIWGPPQGLDNDSGDVSRLQPEEYVYRTDRNDLPNKSSDEHHFDRVKSWLETAAVNSQKEIDEPYLNFENVLYNLKKQRPLTDNSDRLLISHSRAPNQRAVASIQNQTLTRYSSCGNLKIGGGNTINRQKLYTSTERLDLGRDERKSNPTRGSLNHCNYNQDTKYNDRIKKCLMDICRNNELGERLRTGDYTNSHLTGGRESETGTNNFRVTDGRIKIGYEDEFVAPQVEKNLELVTGSANKTEHPEDDGKINGKISTPDSEFYENSKISAHETDSAMDIANAVSSRKDERFFMTGSDSLENESRPADSKCHPSATTRTVNAASIPVQLLKTPTSVEKKNKQSFDTRNEAPVITRPQNSFSTNSVSIIQHITSGYDSVNEVADKKAPERENDNSFKVENIFDSTSETKIDSQQPADVNGSNLNLKSLKISPKIHNNSTKIANLEIDEINNSESIVKKANDEIQAIENNTEMGQNRLIEQTNMTETWRQMNDDESPNHETEMKQSNVTNTVLYKFIKNDDSTMADSPSDVSKKKLENSNLDYSNQSKNKVLMRELNALYLLAKRQLDFYVIEMKDISLHTSAPSKIYINHWLENYVDHVIADTDSKHADDKIKFEDEVNHEYIESNLHHSEEKTETPKEGYIYSSANSKMIVPTKSGIVSIEDEIKNEEKDKFDGLNRTNEEILQLTDTDKNKEKNESELNVFLMELETKNNTSEMDFENTNKNLHETENFSPPTKIETDFVSSENYFKDNDLSTATEFKNETQMANASINESYESINTLKIHENVHYDRCETSSKENQINQIPRATIQNELLKTKLTEAALTYSNTTDDIRATKLLGNHISDVTEGLLETQGDENSYNSMNDGGFITKPSSSSIVALEQPNEASVNDHNVSSKLKIKSNSIGSNLDDSKKENTDIASLKFEARRCLSEGLVSTISQAELMAQLMELKFDRSQSIDAANECSNVHSAVVYLQQDCHLCAEKFSMKQMISMLECEHRCCQECARQFFSLQINEKSIEDCVCPFCGEPNLSKLDSDAVLNYFSNLDIILKTILKPHTHELFQQKLRDRTLMQDPNFKWCSKCSFGFIADLDQKRLSCPSCKAISCASCGKLWTNEHTGKSCEQFNQWLATQNDANNQFVNYLEDNGITCPKCNTTFILIKGGCMHLTCSHCKYEFCSDCSKPFSMGANCKLSDYCVKLGLHAHHPRNCLFYLRDKEPGELKRLLLENNVDITLRETSEKRCNVQLQRETDDGLKEMRCNAQVQEGGLCRCHLKEYLSRVIRRFKLETIDLLTIDDLETLVLREGKKRPPRGYETPENEYYNALYQFVGSYNRSLVFSLLNNQTVYIISDNATSEEVVKVLCMQSMDNPAYRMGDFIKAYVTYNRFYIPE